MPTPRDIVEQCWQGIHGGDFAGARKLLADDLYFRGPIDEFHKADDWISALQQLGGIVKGADKEAVVVDGNEVAVFYTLRTVVADAPVAEWYTVHGETIRAVRAYFDARPFAPPSGGHS